MRIKAISYALKRNDSSVHISGLCHAADLSRQAYYQGVRRLRASSTEEEMVLNAVNTIRYAHPRIGGRKLQHMLSEQGIIIGRDRLLSLLRANDMLVKRRKAYQRTTLSHHHYRAYDNLITDMVLTGPDQLYVSDITYLRIVDAFMYLFLITDAYSRKIVGNSLSRGLGHESAIEAFLEADRGRQRMNRGGWPRLIHHSDRGIQYCCHKFTELLINRGVLISMTTDGNVYDNALAERVNGILKDEYYLGETYESPQALKRAVDQAVYAYNYQRPHSALGYRRPAEVYGC